MDFFNEWNIPLWDKILKACIEKLKEDWKGFYVIYPLLRPAEMSAKIRRLYFILYEVNAPTMYWYEFFKNKYDTAMTLVEFL